MENQRITMVRPHLDDIPQHPLPRGFSLRWYRTGDRETWVRIHERAERYVPATAQVYDKQFGGDETELAQRQAFLLDPHGQEIGTATAWFDNQHQGRRFGRVHWVAIVPEYQGKGLAKPLLTAVCNRLVQLGHDCAYLSTGTARLPAIHLYLSYGFEPEIGDEEDRKRWDEVLARIQRLPPH